MSTELVIHSQVEDSIISVRTCTSEVKGQFIVVSFIDADWPRTKRHIELERVIMGYIESEGVAPSFPMGAVAAAHAVGWHEQVMTGVTEHHPYYLRLAREKLMAGGAKEGLRQ